MQRTSWKFNFDDWQLQANCKLIEESPQTIYQFNTAGHTFSEILPFLHATASWKNEEQNSLQTKLKTVLSVISILQGCPALFDYRKNFKYWDMYVWANSIDSDQTALKEQSDQDLHCLPFFLHLLEALLHCKIKLFYIKDNYGSWSGCPNI